MAISGLGLLSPPIPVLRSFQKPWEEGINYFSSFLRQHIVSQLLLYCYFHIKSLDELYSLVPPVQICSARTRTTNSKDLNRRHFPRIPNITRTFCWAFSQELPLWGTASGVEILIRCRFLSFTPYSNNLQFVPPKIFRHVPFFRS